MVRRVRSIDVPIKHGGAERTGAARTTQEDIPDRVGKLRCLRVRAERGVGAATAERNECDPALRLASLDG